MCQNNSLRSSVAAARQTVVIYGVRLDCVCRQSQVQCLQVQRSQVQRRVAPILTYAGLGQRREPRGVRPDTAAAGHRLQQTKGAGPSSRPARVSSVFPFHTSARTSGIPVPAPCQKSWKSCGCPVVIVHRFTPAPAPGRRRCGSWPLPAPAPPWRTPPPSHASCTTATSMRPFPQTTPAASASGKLSHIRRHVQDKHAA